MSGHEVGATWRSKQELAAWIARRAGVPVDEVVRAHRARAEQRGELWRPNDEVAHVRRKVLARLRDSVSSTSSTTRATPSPAATERAAAVDTPTTLRAARMMGPLR